MLQAMNTGHDGSMTTVHANAPRDAFSRLETMVMMASAHVPDKVIRQQLASAINIVVHCARLADGARRVTGIAEVVGVENDMVEMQDIFEFERTGISPRGKVVGSFRGLGNRPHCMERLKGYGIHLPASIFNEAHEVKDK
jgi:pilus assembly protein CpaF